MSFALFCAVTLRATSATDDDPTLPNPCEIDLDCELNGICANGHCKCDAAWSGRHCEVLNLLPAPKQNGYRQENISSWGGTVQQVYF